MATVTRNMNRALRALRGFHSSRRLLGVTKTILTEGDGKTFPEAGDRLTMHYTGSLKACGTEFDSSVKRGTPFTFVSTECAAVDASLKLLFRFSPSVEGR
eukprot:1333616-Amorphochlora_amoeboformis.AAC.2